MRAWPNNSCSNGKNTVLRSSSKITSAGARLLMISQKMHEMSGGIIGFYAEQRWFSTVVAKVSAPTRTMRCLPFHRPLLRGAAAPFFGRQRHIIILAMCAAHFRSVLAGPGVHPFAERGFRRFAACRAWSRRRVQSRSRPWRADAQSSFCAPIPRARPNLGRRCQTAELH